MTTLAADHDAPSASAVEVGASFGAWWMLSVLLLFYICSFVDRQILTLLVVPIQKELGLSDFSMSLIMGPAYAVFTAIASLPMGWAGDRFSRRWVIFGGVSFWSLCCGASGFAHSFGALFAGRAGVAVGEAALVPAAYSLVSQKFPRRQLTTAIAVLNVAPKLANSVAFLLGAGGVVLATYFARLNVPVIGDLSSWRLTLLVVGVPGILLALLAFTFKEPARPAPGTKLAGDGQALFAFLKSNASLFGPILLGFGLMCVCSGALSSWIPTFITRQHGLSLVEYGPTVSAISLIGAVVLVPKGMLIDWLYARGMRDAHLRFFTWIQIVGLPVVIAMLLVRDSTAFFVLYGFSQIFTLSFILYLAAILQIVTPIQLRGQITAAFMLCTSLILGGVAPPLVAAVTDFVFKDQMKIGYSMLIVCGVSLTGSIIALRMTLGRLNRYLTNAEPQASAPDRGPDAPEPAIT